MDIATGIESAGSLSINLAIEVKVARSNAGYAASGIIVVIVHHVGYFYCNGR